MPQPKNRELTLLITAGILLAFAAADFVTPPVLGSKAYWLNSLVLGVCVAQITLIAIWAVFAPGNIVVRLPWSLLLGLMMWYILSFRERRTADASFDPRNIVVLGLALLLSVSVLQIPLWIAKRAFRYRMVVPGEAALPAGQKPMQFQLKHLVVGTLLLSVALAPIRLVLPKEIAGNLLPRPGLFVVILAVIVVNLVATLPCLWGGFASARKLWSVGPAWTIFSLLVSAVEYMFLCRMVSPPTERDSFWMFYLMNVTQGIVVFAVMRIYRTLGYRLQRVSRKE